jgi:hypothetical protein
MHLDLAVAPGMPRIMDVSQFPNMGVLLLTCTIERETIKVKEMFCSFQQLNNELVPSMAECAARSDWAAF